MRTDETVEQEHDLGSSERADRDEHHAATPQAQDRGDDVSGGGDGSKAANQYAESPVIRAVSLRKRPGGEGSISEPTDIRCAAGASHSLSTNQAEVEQQSAKHTQPETERVESREGQIPRADHERHKIVCKPED